MSFLDRNETGFLEQPVHFSPSDSTTVLSVVWFSQLPVSVLAAIGLALLIAYHYLIAPVLHGHLSHIPGPWLAKITTLQLGWYDLRLVRNDQIYEWHKKYGPIICIGPNEVSVSSLEDTQQVYSSTTRWEKSDYFDHFMGYGERAVFATKPYSEHRARRKLIASFYQASNTFSKPEVESRVRERAQAVLGLAACYAWDNITQLVFGPGFGTKAIEGEGPEKKFLQDLKSLQLWGPFGGQFPLLYKVIVTILTTLTQQYGFLHAESQVSKWSLERFQKAIKCPTVRTSHSLLGRLQEMSKKENEPLRDSYIAAEALDNIGAAEATIAVTATYLVWRLTEHPSWQERIREELQALPKEGDGLPSFTDVNGLPLLEAFLNEVYRLHPASSGKAERVVPQAGSVLAGIPVPPKALVSTCMVAMHRDPDYFPKSDQFLPERWLEGTEAEAKARSSRLIPFGYGSRICLGKPLAIMELKMLVAAIYLRYETKRSASCPPASMKQTSTHDAMPQSLRCVVEFEDLEPTVKA
ncbi:cytochrome p450 domain-containing protein [Penicillium capsulatum]|uniref:Cytochrome p450 domain-containing protein n=1 Tax=Penicillium capsulatum TaxID=69766 RepID=A0A9W9ILR4_9EURO|nr:cytochrome p450 domain-containing protein [Penicillium capsulatum]KAJ6122819.1 cytochrome p450 domain-containing protein [Penicillium capsulatum]